VLFWLEDLTVREPFDERARAQLMIALAGGGEQAAALRVYENLVHRLDEQLGLLPGAELRDAYQRILRQDLIVAAQAVAVSGGQGQPRVARALATLTANFPSRTDAPGNRFIYSLIACTTSPAKASDRKVAYCGPSKSAQSAKWRSRNATPASVAGDEINPKFIIFSWVVVADGSELCRPVLADGASREIPGDVPALNGQATDSEQSRSPGGRRRRR
jgi:hypothetical protein